MKRLFGRIVLLTTLMMMVLLLNSNTKEAQASQVNISIDGYYDDWSDKPYSWEYNWDNPWQIPNYWDGSRNITKEYRDENGNPYNLEIRHRMSLATDGEYVYLHIIVSDNPGAGLYAEDFQFWLDNQMAAFRITFPNNLTLSEHSNNIAPGIYQVEVRHRNSPISDTVVGGASAAFTKKYNDVNNEIEIKIPLSAMKLQNDNINPDTVRTIEFFTPNMMYRRIACSGVSTGPMIGLLIGAVFVGAILFYKKYKNRSKAI